MVIVLASDRPRHVRGAELSGDGRITIDSR